MRPRTLIAVLLVGPILAATAWAQGLPTVAAADVGLSEERLGRLEEVVQGYVDDQAIAGAVTLIARKGGQAHVRGYGMADRASGTPMQPDTIFRIASMTKPMTSVAVMMLYVGTENAADASSSQLFPMVEDYLVKPVGLIAVGGCLLGLHVLLSLRFIPQIFEIQRVHAFMVVLLGVLAPHLAGFYLVGKKMGFIQA